MARHRGVVASTVCASLFDAQPQRLHVVHRSRLAWQLVDKDGRPAMCLLTGEALRLPHGVMMSALPQKGSSVRVGEGSLEWDGARVQVARWWDPARPQLPRLRSRVHEPAAAELIGTWSATLGRGEGLTPYDDDVVCGSLVALHCAGHPAAAIIARDMAGTDVESRTTTTSAALLRLAAAGWCIDPLADHLTAVDAGGSAAECLLKVGHSSGRGLLEGVDRIFARPVEMAA